jgi:hypothetical protein
MKNITSQGLENRHKKENKTRFGSEKELTT